MKICAEDCDFVCPFSAHHNLTEYHMINHVRNGVRNKTLQQELLQKADTLNTLQLIVDHCTNFESAKLATEKLHTGDSVVSSIGIDEQEDLSQEEIVAAISAYRKNKKQGVKDRIHHNAKDRFPQQSETGKTCNHMHRVESNPSCLLMWTTARPLTYLYP